MRTELVRVTFPAALAPESDPVPRSIDVSVRIGADYDEIIEAASTIRYDLDRVRSPWEIKNAEKELDARVNVGSDVLGVRSLGQLVHADGCDVEDGLPCPLVHTDCCPGLWPACTAASILDDDGTVNVVVHRPGLGCDS